eukprot:jgi/Ulvmu1/5285/UM022_0079.1
MFSRTCARPTGRVALPRRSVVTRAAFETGDKVKVKVDMKVYHVPGFKEGLEIKDKEGTIDANITEFKGVSLSPNYPWKIKIDYEASGKPKKFFVHLDEDEIEKM